MNEDEIRASKRIINKDFFIIKNNPNYSLKLYHLIEKVNSTKDESFEDNNNEYILNLLLMSSKLNDQNRLACLLLLYYLKRRDGRNQDLINYLFFKICKLCIEFENSEDEIIQKFLYFPESPNFIYSLEYLTSIKKIFSSEKNLDRNYKTFLDTLEIATKEKINLYLEENFSKFNSFDLIPEEHLTKIKNIFDQLFKGTYPLKNSSNGTSLYLISNIWLSKLKTFLEPYIEARKEHVVNLLSEGAFNFEKVLNYINKQSFENTLGVIFPGPINNLNLSHIKDFWYDPINIEENDIIKNGLKYLDDFLLVNKDDYILLKSIFKDTNELRRKNADEEIYKFKIIIIEPRLAQNEYKYVLKRRYLQTNINGNLKELKNKIIRCLYYELDNITDKNYYEHLYENNKVDFFVVDKKNKEMLIELFISLVNKNKIYESLYIQQIKLDNNETCIKNLFNYFDKKTQILIAEIIPKNSYNFIKPIISEHKNPNIYNCCICGEQLNLKEKYNCKLCNLSLFCSYECAKISGEHINLHEALDKFYMKNFDLDNFLKEKDEFNLYKENIREIIPFNKNKLNNFSAINSIIHCLFNSKDLTKYFLSKKYLDDLNINDYLLNKNILINYYSDLIDKMWKNDSKEKLEISHINFLNFLLKKLDYDVNDKSSLNNVREIIAFILINFHKEMNRTNNLNLDLVKSKKKSIISDLFQGIQQTIFSCTKCGNVSIIYDFFSYLLLPIPKKNSNLTIKYFSEKDWKNIYYTMNDNSDIKELKDKAFNYLSEKINKIVQMMSVTDLIDITAFDTDDEKILTEVAMYNSLELVQLDKNKIVNKVYLTDKKDLNKEKNENENDEDNNNYTESDLKLQLNKIYKENDIELVFYEKDVFEEPCINIYIYPFIYNEKEKMNVNRDRLYHVYPIALPTKLSLILENFEYYVNVKLRSLLMDYYKDESEKRNVNFIELVYPHYFCNNSQYSSATCFLCKEKTKNTLFCPLFSSLDKDLSIKDLIQKFDYPKQPIIFLAKCKYFDINKKYYTNMNCFYNKRESVKKPENKLDIYNCFQLNSKKETLHDIDWFCEGCNSIQICEKQLSIYHLPIYLIIQIDRLALKKINNKNSVDNTFLNIPVNNLDLNKFVEGPDKNKENYKYNLYAIIYKDISSKNDFTYCTCKNGNKWILFKDNKIQVVNELINKNVHFLFYKREDAQ